MRLHRLEFEAIGPFSDHHAIDFDELATSGLFLLSGPTGSGKSTLIDAIVFGLYGASGSGADNATKERLHSLAAPSTTPWVELTFSNDYGIYRVRRTPEHTAPKLRGTGTTTRNGTCLLLRLSGPDDIGNPDAGEVIAHQVADAGTKLGEIIGLTREQFTQTMVLPQGQFSRFLTAKPEVRTEILRDILGAKLYQDLQNALKERASKAEKLVERAARNAAVELLAVTNTLEEVPEAITRSRFTPPQPVTDVDASIPDSELLSNTELDAVLDERIEVVVSIAEAARLDAIETRSIYDETLAEASRLSDIARRQHDCETARLRRRELDDAEADILQAEAAVAADMRARPIIAASTELTTDIAEFNATLDELATSDVPSRLPSSVDEIIDVDRSPFEAELLSAKNAFELSARSIERAEGELAALQGHARRIEALGDELAELTKVDEADGERHLAATSELEATTAALTEQERDLAELTTSAANVEDLREHASRQQAIVQAAHKAATLLKKIASLQEAVAQCEAAAHQANERARARQDAHVRHTAGDLAAELSPGSPCPVCGALEHPNPASPHDTDVTAADVRAAIAEAQQSAEALAAQRVRLSEASEQHAEAHSAAGGSELAEAESAYRQAADALAAAEQAQLGATARKDAIAALQHRRVELDAECRNLAERRAASADRLTALRAERAQEQETLGDKLAGAASIEELATELQAKRTDNDRARTIIQSAIQMFAGITRAGTNLKRHLEESEFASFDAAQRAALTDERRTELAASISAHREAAVTVAAVLGDPANHAALAHGQVDVTEVEELRRAADSRNERTSALAAVATSWRDAVLTARTTAQRARAEYDRQAAGVVDEIALGHLADGRNGRSLTLSTFVVLDMFDSVLHVTNERLAEISDGRYHLQRSNERESGRNRKLGLSLTVFDAARGRTRSLSSLSGGETFYTALSLALGLADTVRATHGGIEMNTLFIDEGFGSLDSGTLDQVMSVLHQLHASGRAVGVVSHVEEMKQQIADRIEVTKREDATSTLRVYAG